MSKYQTMRDLQVSAVQFKGTNIEDFKEAIGVGAQYLSFNLKDIGGPGRGAHKALVIESADHKWTIDKLEWLLVFPNGELFVMDNLSFSKLFEVAYE